MIFDIVLALYPALVKPERYTLDGLLLTGTFNTADGIATADNGAQTGELAMNLADGVISGEGNPADIEMKAVQVGKRYEAILLPTASTTREIVFDLKNGYEAPFIWKMDSDLKGGNLYNYTTVKLTRTGMALTGTIEAWKEVNNNNENIAN